MSPQKIKLWYWVLIGELFFASLTFLAVSFFAEPLGIDSGGNWGSGRILFAVFGFVIGLIPVVLWLPGIRQFALTAKVAQFSRYTLESAGWILVAFGLVELILQITVVRKPVLTYEQDWEVVPMAGSERFWGREGYGITHYLHHGEIATPFDNGTTSVVVLGDSYTEAWQVSDDTKFVSFAEKKLRSTGELVNLHNLGMSGDSIPDYIYLAPIIKQYYHPKIIVIQLGPQDFYGEDGGDSFNSKHRNYFVTNGYDALEVHHTDQNAKSDLYNKLISRMIVYSLGLERVSQIVEREGKELNIGKEITSAFESGRKIFPIARLDEQLILLKRAYSGLKVVLLLLPDSPIIDKTLLNFDDNEYQKLLESVERVGGFYIINPTFEFDRLTVQGYLPRGFRNSSLPGSGHLNKIGHTILGNMLAEKILEILH